jgi:ATP:cob(I)alamin adenosyltransferase
LDNILATIQNELFDLGAEMSIPITENNKEIIEKTKISEKQIERLENEIDQLNVSLSDLESFVLPGGTIASSYLHLARTVIRKAERLMVKMDNLEENSVSETALKYINRLSDLLFVAARYANQTDIGGTGDILWRPGQSRED